MTISTVVQIERAQAAAAARLERVGVLLVNLGTHDTADTRGVRVYLKEFLSDPRVIENQGLLWKLILNGIILRTRPAKKAPPLLKTRELPLPAPPTTKKLPYPFLLTVEPVPSTIMELLLLLGLVPIVQVSVPLPDTKLT